LERVGDSRVAGTGLPRKEISSMRCIV